MKYKASITYSTSGGQFKHESFTDVYTFSPVYWNPKEDADAIRAYIKNDMQLVAAGGYNKSLATIESFDLKRID